MDHPLFNVNEDFSRVLQNDDVLFYEDGRLYSIYAIDIIKVLILFFYLVPF